MTALLIILGIIIFIMLILAIPVNIYSKYNEEFVLYIRYLFIKYYIYPPQEKKNKKKKKEKKPKDEKKDDKKEEEKEEKPKEKSDNFIKTFYNDQGVSGIIELISTVAAKLKKGMGKIGRSFYIKTLWLRINVADGDAANTAQKYGKVCAAVYPPLGYILSTVHSKNCSVKINPDFLGGKSQGAFKLSLNLIPLKLIGACISLVFSLGIELIKVLITNSKNASKRQAAKQKAVSKEAEKNKTKISVEAENAETRKGGKI